MQDSDKSGKLGVRVLHIEPCQISIGLDADGRKASSVARSLSSPQEVVRVRAGHNTRVILAVRFGFAFTETWSPGPRFPTGFRSTTPSPKG